MSFVIATPDVMTSAATDLATIGSDLSMAHTAAATPTVALARAAGDEVSAGVAHVFSRYADDFHALGGRATAFHEQFFQNMKASAASYTSAEDAITWLLAGGATSGPLAQELGSVAQELFSFVAAVVFAVLVVGFFAVAVPIVVVLQMIESFIQQLGSLLP